MADYAERLARTYMKRGESSRDWKDYLKAHGLANYCVAIDSTAERCRLVYDVEVSWYKGNHPISYEEHQQLTNKHKQLLNEYRDEIKSNFLPLDVLGVLLDPENIYSDENMTNAHRFCDELFELSKKSSDEFVLVARCIIESSVEALKSIKRKAPCDFAVIGLGSVAKGEATPYSDVEYAFITERDDSNYFEMLAMDSYFRIGNLGETPLKCFNIEELIVDKGSPQLIPDLKTVGFRIDGISKNAGNIPTGNGLEKGQPLTFTVESLMELYKKEAEAPFTGLADKSDMLSSTVVIYTNEGDESRLHNRFIEERTAYELKVAQNSAVVKEKRVLSFLKDINTFTFLPEFVKYQPPQNMNIRVKTDIFRYPTLLANNIKMFMGWNLLYPWQIYSELHSCENLSKEAYSYIRIVLALSIYMRTRAYLHHRCQTEYVSLLPQVRGSVKELYRVSSSLFVILGCLLAPIKRSVRSNVEKTLVTADDTSLANAIRSVMEHIEFDKTYLMAKVEICYFSGEYELARKELSNVLTAYGVTLTSSEFLKKFQQTIDDPSTITKYMELCCYILYHAKSYRPAIDFFSWLIDNVRGDIGFWKLLSAHCRKEIGDYRATKQLLDEAKQHLQPTCGPNNSTNQLLYTTDTNHSDISISYRDIGAVYRVMGEHTEALKYLKLALEMDIAMYGETVHPDIATGYGRMGTAYYGLGEYRSAFIYLIKSLKMMKAMYGADTNHPDIADIYNNIGLVYESRGDYKLSLEYHTKSLRMRKAIYGADANHPDIAAGYNNIALVCNKLCDHKSSLQYHIVSLKMQKAIYGTDTNHPHIAAVYINIAAVYMKLGNYKLSLEYSNKSIEMMKALYGADANHPDIANSYNIIASVHYNCGEYTLSLEQHIESLRMKKVLYGADANHPDIADSYNNIANAYNKIGDYKLSLQYHIKSLRMKEAIHGADSNHPGIADSCNNIGLVYEMCGNYKLSLQYHIKSLTIKTAVYGAEINHSAIADSYNNIALVCNKVGDVKLSLKSFSKSLRMKEAIYGADANHPAIADSYNNIGIVYERRGDYKLSLEYYIKSLKMRKAISGTNANHPAIASSYNNIALVYYKCGDYTSALQYYIKSLQMKKCIYGTDTDHPSITDSYHNIALVYKGCGDYESSLEYLIKSLKMREAMYGTDDNHPYITGEYISIASVYYKCGDYVLSLEYYIKALNVM